MRRVQAALGVQLSRQNQKLEVELREKVSLVGCGAAVGLVVHRLKLHLWEMMFTYMAY